jgi:hypothetical protein
MVARRPLASGFFAFALKAAAGIRFFPPLTSQPRPLCVTDL